MGLTGLEAILVARRTLFSSSNPQGESLVLLDATALIHYLWFQQFSIDWIHGGEFMHFEFNVRIFIAKLLDCGLKPKVYFDGIADPLDFSESDGAAPVDADIKSSAVASHEMVSLLHKRNVIPPTVSESLKTLLRKLNIEVCVCLYKAELELADAYGRARGPRYVFGDSHNYLVLPVHYVPLKSILFTPDALECQVYDWRSTCQQLNIPEATLPYLPVLAGCSYLEPKNQEKFPIYRLQSFDGELELVRVCAKYLRENGVPSIDELVPPAELILNDTAFFSAITEVVNRFSVNSSSEYQSRKKQARNVLSRYDLFQPYCDGTLHPAVLAILMALESNANLPAGTSPVSPLSLIPDLAYFNSNFKQEEIGDILRTCQKALLSVLRRQTDEAERLPATASLREKGIYLCTEFGLSSQEVEGIVNDFGAQHDFTTPLSILTICSQLLSSFQPEVLQCFLLSTVICQTMTDAELNAFLSKLQSTTSPQFAAHVSELSHVASSVHHEMYCFLLAFHNGLAIFLQANSVLANPISFDYAVLSGNIAHALIFEWERIWEKENFDDRRGPSLGRLGLFAQFAWTHLISTPNSIQKRQLDLLNKHLGLCGWNATEESDGWGNAGRGASQTATRPQPRFGRAYVSMATRGQILYTKDKYKRKASGAPTFATLPSIWSANARKGGPSDLGGASEDDASFEEYEEPVASPLSVNVVFPNLVVASKNGAPPQEFITIYHQPCRETQIQHSDVFEKRSEQRTNYQSLQAFKNLIRYSQRFSQQQQQETSKQTSQPNNNNNNASARKARRAGASAKIEKLDDFQQEALDHIEQLHSIVVTAPTGAGKTEVAMKAIEKILRDTKQRVVYISPTKALVNQIFIELLQRYAIAIDHQRDDNALVGILTADFQIFPHARVLITVPQVFEKILLDLHQSDALQLGYVVLDEIHFIQDRETGAVWERILLLLSETCPFVALSATIGNADEFVAWIRTFHPHTYLVKPRVMARPVPLEFFLWAEEQTTKRSKPGEMGSGRGGTKTQLRSINPLVFPQYGSMREHFSARHAREMDRFLAAATEFVCGHCKVFFATGRELYQHCFLERASSGHETFTTDEALVATIRQLYIETTQRREKEQENYAAIFAILQRKPNLLKLFAQDDFSAAFHQAYQSHQQQQSIGAPPIVGSHAHSPSAPTAKANAPPSAATNKIPDSHLELADIVMQYLNGSLLIDGKVNTHACGVCLIGLTTYQQNEVVQLTAKANLHSVVLAGNNNGERNSKKAATNNSGGGGRDERKDWRARKNAANLAEDLNVQYPTVFFYKRKDKFYFRDKHQKFYTTVHKTHFSPSIGDFHFAFETVSATEESNSAIASESDTNEKEKAAQLSERLRMLFGFRDMIERKRGSLPGAQCEEASMVLLELEARVEIEKRRIQKNLSEGVSIEAATVVSAEEAAADEEFFAAQLPEFAVTCVDGELLLAVCRCSAAMKRSASHFTGNVNAPANHAMRHLKDLLKEVSREQQPQSNGTDASVDNQSAESSRGLTANAKEAERRLIELSIALPLEIVKDVRYAALQKLFAAVEARLKVWQSANSLADIALIQSLFQFLLGLFNFNASFFLPEIFTHCLAFLAALQPSQLESANANQATFDFHRSICDLLVKFCHKQTSANISFRLENLVDALSAHASRATLLRVLRLLLQRVESGLDGASVGLGEVRDFPVQSSWDAMGAEDFVVLLLNTLQSSKGQLRTKVGSDECYQKVEELIRAKFPKSSSDVFLKQFFEAFDCSKQQSTVAAGWDVTDDPWDMGIVRQEDDSSDEEEDATQQEDLSDEETDDLAAAANAVRIARAYDQFHALPRHHRIALQQCLSTALFCGPSANFEHSSKQEAQPAQPGGDGGASVQSIGAAGGPSSVNAVRLPRMNRLVRKLHVRRMLPAIIFQHARNQVASLFASIFPSDKIQLLDDEDRAKLDAAIREYEQIEDKTLFSFHAGFFETLRMGIGLHHAGLSKCWRFFMERLFRHNVIKIIIATATLAVGIHMPCKAVVFYGDSDFLTPSQFQQMSGRSGRRGFDTKGNILFLGFPFVKIKHLITSQPENLTGQSKAKLSTLLNLLHLQAQNQTSSQGAKFTHLCRNMIQNPLASFAAGQHVANSPQAKAMKLRLQHALHVSLLRQFSLVLPVTHQPNLLLFAMNRLDPYYPTSGLILHLILNDHFENLSPVAIFTTLCYLYPVTFPALSAATDADSNDTRNTVHEIEPLPCLPDCVFDGIRLYNAIVHRALSEVLARAENEESHVRSSTSDATTTNANSKKQQAVRYQPLHACLSRQELARRLPTRRILQPQGQGSPVNVFLRMSGHSVSMNASSDSASHQANSFASFDHWKRHVQSQLGPIEAVPFFLLQYSDEGGTCGFLHHLMFGEESREEEDSEHEASGDGWNTHASQSPPKQQQRNFGNRTNNNNNSRREALSFAARRRLLSQLAASIKKSEMELLELLGEFFHFMKDVLAVVQFCERIWPAYLFQSNAQQRNPHAPSDPLRDLSGKLRGLVAGFCRKLTALDFDSKKSNSLNTGVGYIPEVPLGPVSYHPKPKPNPQQSEPAQSQSQAQYQANAATQGPVQNNQPPRYQPPSQSQSNQQQPRNQNQSQQANQQQPNRIASRSNQSQNSPQQGRNNNSNNSSKGNTGNAGNVQQYGPRQQGTNQANRFNSNQQQSQGSRSDRTNADQNDRWRKK